MTIEPHPLPSDRLPDPSPVPNRIWFRRARLSLVFLSILGNWFVQALLRATEVGSSSLGSPLMFPLLPTSYPHLPFWLAICSFNATRQPDSRRSGRFPSGSTVDIPSIWSRPKQDKLDRRGR